ncbi:MAG: hypothetical protein LC679_18045 [Intrasporangiaceae bacterium]|nr:hypothetical protein [Intrasporangiaceae bacterium]
MYLRQTKRTNKDGSVVSYLQLARNERHPASGAPTAKVIHNFGCAEKVDRAALARLVSSISRLLTPEQAAAGGGVHDDPAGTVRDVLAPAPGRAGRRRVEAHLDRCASAVS